MSKIFVILKGDFINKNIKNLLKIIKLSLNTVKRGVKEIELNKKICLITFLALILLTSAQFASYNMFTVKAQSQIKVFILTSDFPGSVSDVVSKLSVFPDLSIDVYNLQTAPLPNLTQLMQYNAGLVWANYQLGSAPGDLISDYVDAGGGMVVMWAADFNGWALTGRYVSTGKNLLPQNVYGYGEPAELGEIVIPNHPIMQGVNKFTNYCFRNIVSYTVNGGICRKVHFRGCFGCCITFRQSCFS